MSNLPASIPGSTSASSDAPATSETPVEAAAEEVVADPIEATDDATEETSEDGAEPTPAEVKKIEKQLRKLKLKVDGKEYDEEIDVNDEAKLIELAQLAKMSKNRAAETVKERKARAEFEQNTKSQMQALVDALKNDPESVLSHPQIGHNMKELAQKLMAKIVAEEAKTPEVKEAEAAKAELEALRKKVKDSEEARNTAEKERRFNEELQRYSTEIQAAMQKYELPNNPTHFARVVELVEVSEKNGLKIPVEDLVKVAKEEINQETQKLLNGLTDEQLEVFLGEALVKKIKQQSLKRKKDAPNVNIAQIIKPSEEVVKPKSGKTLADFLKD